MKPRCTLSWILLLAAPSLALAVEPPAGPLDEDEAVRIALRQNHSYLEQAAGEGVSAGSRLSALAGVLPFFQGSYTLSREKSTTTLVDFPVVSDLSTGDPISISDLDLESKPRSGAFGVSAQEDLSLSRWYNYRAAVHDLARARYHTEASAQDLAFTVRNQFYLVLRAQDLLRVQEEDLRLAVDQQSRIQSMFELGSVARVDVLKAQVRASEAEVALIRQRNAVDIETSRMGTLLGFSPSTRLVLAGDLNPRPAALDSASATEEAMVRPDVQRAEATLKSAKSLHKAAVTSRIPGLFAGFDYNLTNGTQEGQDLTSQADTSSGFLVTFPVDRASDFDRDGWTVRGGVSVSLDAFLNSGDAKSAGATKRQAELALEGTKLAVQQELEEAILNYRASVSAIAAAETGVTAAEEDQRLSQERYTQGLGTVLELLESQVNLTRARNTLVNAQTGLKISEAALDKARGAPLPM